MTFAHRLLRTAAFPPTNPPSPYAWIGAAHNNDGPPTATNLYFLTSTDGLSWTLRASAIGSDNPSHRDPSPLWWHGAFWLAATRGDFPYWHLYRSTDGVTWTYVGAPATGTATKTWAPHWFTDVDGSVHVLVSLYVGSWGIWEMHPTNDAMTTWSAPVQVTGTGFYSPIDPALVIVGSTYYLFWKNDPAGTICLSTSSSPFSGYTAIKTGDWAGWGTPREGPSVVQLPDGTWRIYFTNNSGYVSAGIYYSETSAPDLLSGWSARTLMSALNVYNHLVVERY